MLISLTYEKNYEFFSGNVSDWFKPITRLLELSLKEPTHKSQSFKDSGYTVFDLKINVLIEVKYK